ncbi:MAG: hypothetical protein SGILL_004321 [Bacillariaceae sp.]
MAYVDPETQARVSLLGVFHGTTSSAQDVEALMTESKTDVVVLELCASRFADLQKEQERQRIESAANSELPQKKSWPVRYAEMVVQTVKTKGLTTGFAAALLGGFSGMQSAMSGFVPGLEFTTALELSMREDEKDPSNIDIILADQAVDETLRKLGNFGGTATEIFLWEQQPNGQRSRRDFVSATQECQLHLSTLQQAVFGGSKDDNSSGIPQVNLPSVLFRNSAAVNDLVRLALPSTVLIALTSQLFATMLGEQNELEAIMEDLRSISQFIQAPILSFDSVLEGVVHAIASTLILSFGTLLVIPVVKTILTERDEILTSNIQTACQRAGKNGKVVAVLVSLQCCMQFCCTVFVYGGAHCIFSACFQGLLHVNGVARRMLDAHGVPKSMETDTREPIEMQR